jgi:hypothetical protein
VSESLTKQERAVVDAALKHVRLYGAESELGDAVDALIKARAAEPPSIDALCAKIKEQHPDNPSGAPARARVMIIDNIRRGHWPASNAAEVGTLDANTVRDTRNAGPWIWKTWADALRALDIEPTWAKELGV